jgi:hypothetical protein
MGSFGDHYVPRIGGLLEARRHVSRVTDGCVVHSKIAANASHHDQTGIDTLPHMETDPAALKILLVTLQGLLDSQSRMHRPLRMVFMRDWRAKEGHDAVTEELVHSSLVPMDLAQHKLECLVH